VAVVPAGSILVLWTADGQRVDLLNLSATTVDHDGALDVLVLAEVGERERGTVELPTEAGLLRIPALLEREPGRLLIHPPDAAQPLQRRLAPRSGLVLPLRGAAQTGAAAAGLPGAHLLTFHGNTVDVGPGGLRARVVGDGGERLPANLHSVFVELDPDNPQSVAVGLRVVTFRSDVLRAQFSFISLVDWTKLRDRARDQA